MTVTPIQPMGNLRPALRRDGDLRERHADQQDSDHRLPGVPGVWLADAPAAALLLPVVALRQENRPSQLNRKDATVLGGVALVGMFLFSILMLYGMRQVSGVVGSIVMSTTPAVTASSRSCCCASNSAGAGRLGWRWQCSAC